MPKSTILIFGDSLSLPRRIHNHKGVLYDILTYHDTYISKLTNYFLEFNFVTIARGGQTSEILNVTELVDINNQKKLYLDIGEYNPSLIIIFLGIVDCAPRLFTRNESAILSKAPKLISKLIIKIAKKLRNRSVKRAYVDISRYTNYFENIFKYSKLNNINIGIVGIPYGDKRVINNNPYIIDAAKKYNDSINHIIKEKYPKIQFINLFNFNNEDRSDYFLDDGYHLSKMGHQLVFESIKSLIVNIN
jgi:acyl-CoA thioesterase-1